ncbi:MAG: hypothetical protein IJQ15_11365 [Synergistaceae bacterium]|nr:hypothetical protein [Synergistaceae bacterium]
MIYTSYYANRNLYNAPIGLRLIGISLKIPVWFKGGVFRHLAPTSEILNIKDKMIYTRRYREVVLSRLDPVRVYNVLDNSVLLCWESPEKFCHRHIVAQWLKEATGNKVMEFDRKEPELQRYIEFE